jgi:polysaccharide chain length determinant protein (PEP-CTERM system associated)
MENARRFLDQQIASYECQLRNAEKRRADFRARYVDLLPSDGNGGESRLDLARMQLIGLRGQLEDAVQRRDALRKELSTTPPNTNIDADIRDGAPSRLRTAQDQLAELRLRFTDQHPDVIAMKKLIAVLKTERSDAGSAASRGRIRSISNPMYEQLKVRLVDAEGQVASLQRQVTDATGERERMEAMARSTPGVHAEYENLDRDYSVLRKNYEELLGRREAANIAEAADTQADKVKLQIVDPPRIPRIAVSPNRLLLIPGVLLAGLAGGSGLAFLLGQTDRSFRTLDDLRVLGLPVLGGISLLDTIPRRKRLISAFGFGLAVTLLAVACGGLLTQLLRQSALV